MTNNGNIEPSDVDIQVTVRNDQDSDEYPGKTIQQIAKNVLTELAQKKYGLSATPEKIKTFIDDHFLEKSTGYVGIGHCKEDDFLDIFNANTFVLKASDTPDYTANSAFYRYSEEEPFLFSKSKMALTDAINSQLRLTKNWFDAVKSFVNKPAEILRYIYFRCQKGYKASQDDGLTRYAILAAITQLVKISQSDDEELKKSKEGGQYFEHLENIKSGNRLGNGTVDHGNITTETDIARVTDKFFMKKFNTPSKAMDALRFLRDDHIHYTPELLAFAEIIKALLDDVDQTGLYKNESEQLIKDIKKEVEKGTAKADVQLDHTVPLIDLFDLMSEITSGLPQDSCIKLKSDLNKMVVDTGKSLDFAALKTIVTNCQSDSIDKAVQDKIDYFTLCMDQLMDQSIPQITRYEAQTWV